MSVHARQHSSVQPVAVERLKAALTHADAIAVVHRLISAQAENDRQRLLVWNPDPEINSLSEIFTHALRRDQDPVRVLTKGLPIARDLLDSNKREREHVRAATGPANFVVSLLADPALRQGLGIKRAAELLRDPLKTIRRAQTEPIDARSYFLACGAIKDVVGEMTTDALRSPSMRGQLGTGLHDVLCGLLTDGAESEAA